MKRNPSKMGRQKIRVERVSPQAPKLSRLPNQSSGFTGENAGRNPKTLAELSKVCPLAFHRRMRAEYWRAAHPFIEQTAGLP
jgi:hypothetical protein